MARINFCTALATCLCLLILVSFSHAESGIKYGPSDSNDAPITISASIFGMFSKGNSWNLNIKANRNAELIIDTYPEKTIRNFRVWREDIETLRNALIKEKFFELADEYGQIVPEGDITILKVSVGGLSKTVKIHYLMNWVYHDQQNLIEPSRAIRIFNIIRGWFDDPEAADLRKYDNMVLDAVEKLAQHKNYRAKVNPRPWD